MEKYLNTKYIYIYTSLVTVLYRHGQIVQPLPSPYQQHCFHNNIIGVLFSRTKYEIAPDERCVPWWSARVVNYSTVDTVQFRREWCNGKCFLVWKPICESMHPRWSRLTAMIKNLQVRCWNLEALWDPLNEDNEQVGWISRARVLLVILRFESGCLRHDCVQTVKWAHAISQQTLKIIHWQSVIRMMLCIRTIAKNVRRMKSLTDLS